MDHILHSAITLPEGIHHKKKIVHGGYHGQLSQNDIYNIINYVYIYIIHGDGSRSIAPCLGDEIHLPVIWCEQKGYRVLTQPHVHIMFLCHSLDMEDVHVVGCWHIYRLHKLSWWSAHLCCLNHPPKQHCVLPLVLLVLWIKALQDFKGGIAAMRQDGWHA